MSGTTISFGICGVGKMTSFARKHGYYIWHGLTRYTNQVFNYTD